MRESQVERRGAGLSSTIACYLWSDEDPLTIPRQTKHTFSVSSFLTDFRFVRRSMETLCLEPRRDRRMASAETLTLLKLGRLNFPLRSRTLMFRSLICGTEEVDNHRDKTKVASIFMGYTTGIWDHNGNKYQTFLCNLCNFFLIYISIHKYSDPLL